MKQVYLVGAILAVLVLAIFTGQNGDKVHIHFLIWQSPELTVAAVALVGAVIGAILTFLLDGIRHMQSVREIKQTMNQKLQQKAAGEAEKPPAEQ
ncbi:MAG: lipopolysaccharide assembly protein LapA domain-containing protein [Solirubrobacterales bacterium]